MWNAGRFEVLALDLRYAVRGLWKSRGVLVVVVVSLALGIGANSTIFSVLSALLYRPLPYDRSGNLVAIWQTEPDRPGEIQAPPIAETVDWRKQNHVFEDIALTSFLDSDTLSGSGLPSPQTVGVQYATPNLFSLLGVEPILGRVFRAEEAQDQSQTILLSNSFWKRHLNGDPHVLGRTFNVEGVVSTVVGVMPPKFAPFLGQKIDVWVPINPESSRYVQRFDHWLMPVGRLKPGIDLKQAQLEMSMIARRLEQAYPATNKGVGSKVVPLHEFLFGWARQGLYPLFGAVAFVLLIACVNVANLLQSRSEARRREYAVRASLGAGRGRLMQQLLTESGLLAFLGGLFGILLTFLGIFLFRNLVPELPNADSITIDARVLLFTLGVSLLTAIIFGLGPAIQASRPNLNLALGEAASRSATSSRGRIRHLLALSEVALAMVLLVGAGLMINTLLRLQKVDPGFDRANVFSTYISLPEGGKYLERMPGDMEKTLPRVTSFYQRLLERVSSLPGVESAGVISTAPPGLAGMYTFSILGHPAPPPDQRPRAGFDEVSASIFRTLRIPLRRGRYLDDHDTETAPWAVVINEAFARRYFPNQDPIGQQILLRYDPYPVDEERPRQIVGVVGDVKHRGLEEETPPFVYASYLQQPAVFPGGAAIAHLRQSLVVRSSSGLAEHSGVLAEDIRKVVAELDPEQPVGELVTMDQILEDSIVVFRLYMQLLGVFASIALALAVFGIYGVMSYFVSQRTREIGIRVALGATPGSIRAFVVKLGLKLTAIGVVVGAVLALGLTRLIAQFLFGVKPADPLTYSAVAVGLSAIALLACYLPARRATKVDPMVVLRIE